MSVSLSLMKFKVVAYRVTFEEYRSDGVSVTFKYTLNHIIKVYHRKNQSTWLVKR